MSSIQRATKLIEWYSTSIISWNLGYLKENGEGGEFIQFNPDQLICCLILAFGLSEIARKRSVRFHVSIDGAQISKRLVHVTMGLKVVDEAAICPFSKRPFVVSESDKLMQSRNHCFPICIMMHKDTSEIYDYVKPLYKILNTLSNHSPDPLPQTSRMAANGYLPIQLVHNGDMAATWKLTGLGGAAKRDKYPCYCCAIESSELWQPRSGLHICSVWCAGPVYERNKQEVEARGEVWKCYHQPFLDTATVERMTVELEAYKESLRGLSETINTHIGKRPKFAVPILLQHNQTTCSMLQVLTLSSAEHPPVKDNFTHR
jgi:hypothetical protein